MSIFHAFCSGALTLSCIASSVAQMTAPLDEIVSPVSIDSGWVQASPDSDQRGTIFSTVVEIEGAKWLRLEFAAAVLGQTPIGGQPTALRLTSLLDGAAQTLNTSHLQQWQNTSAYFNGDAILVEIVADPGAPASRLVIDKAHVGVPLVSEGGGIASICGPADDRVLSSDPRAARIVPVGCTAWLFDDAAHTFLTAGHCTGPTFTTIEFNVPMSSVTGELMHPSPEDQYAIDPASIQFTDSGLGNDWCYFGCFPNTNTGLTPYAAQNDFYVLAPAAPPLGGQTIRITGYGTDDTPLQNNQVQQTHSGPYTLSNGTLIQYQVDTTAGNSGSAVFDEVAGNAIGIHTNAGCNGTGGANQGTAIHNSGLQNALANPQGVCVVPPQLTFNFPDGLPDNLNPAGDSIRVEVQGANGGAPQPGTGLLLLDAGDGAGFNATPMSEVSPNIYDAIFPATTCEATLKFKFSAQTMKSETITSPGAPSASHSALSALATESVFSDDFEIDNGWTASADPGVTTGFWERGVPAGGGDRRDPPTDADGSGKCYVTDNLDGNFDIDGGAVRLTSPILDASAPNPYLEYDRWFSSSITAGDNLVVEVSDNGGASWAVLEVFTGSVDEWVHKSWPIEDIAGVSPTDQFRVRFTAIDAGTPSVAEAGLDGVVITSVICTDPAGCPADVDGSGSVGVDDLLDVINAWGTAGATDVDQSGTTDVDDLLAVIAAWGDCPP